MSLVSLALRVAVARCLRGRTFAKDRIFDSAIAPIDLTLAEERRPLIVVTSDQERATVTGRDLLGTEREIDLVLELALATFVPRDDGVEVLIPHTDEGMEVALDLMVRQVHRALIEGDTAWSRVFLAFVPRIRQIEQKRGAGSEDGVRFAARQMLIVCDTIADPPFGAAVDSAGPWQAFLDALGEDIGTAGLVSLVEAAILGAPLPDWDVLRLQLGLSRPETAGIGIAPTDETAVSDADSPLVDEIDVSGDRESFVVSMEALADTDA